MKAKTKYKPTSLVKEETIKYVALFSLQSSESLLNKR